MSADHPNKGSDELKLRGLMYRHAGASKHDQTLRAVSKICGCIDSLI